MVWETKSGGAKITCNSNTSDEAAKERRLASVVDNEDKLNTCDDVKGGGPYKRFCEYC